MDEPLKALEELGDQFERAAYAAGRPGRRGRRARRRRVLFLAAVGALLVAATAMAASGLLTGEPVRNPPGVTFKADEGLGKPVPDQTNLLDLRVPDPAGGPPWGMRTVRTTRGLGCVQIGRVVEGKLGVLGQNGAFGDDGRFHELPADGLTEAYCEQPDGAGNVFIAISYQGMPASALPQGCRPSAQPEPLEIAGRPKGPAPSRRANRPTSGSCTSACSARKPGASPTTTSASKRPPRRCPARKAPTSWSCAPPNSIPRAGASFRARARAAGWKASSTTTPPPARSVHRGRSAAPSHVRASDTSSLRHDA